MYKEALKSLFWHDVGNTWSGLLYPWHFNLGICPSAFITFWCSLDDVRVGADDVMRQMEFWILTILLTMSFIILGAYGRPTAPTRPTMYLDIAMNNSTCTIVLYGEATSKPHIHQTVYDHRGAMYFAVAVISLYGVSIALLIGSTLRRDDTDYELKGFLRSLVV